MKYIEDIRDKHKGEEIWVIGAGPSLDDYPIDFFEDKICVGMNWVFTTFIDIGDNIEKFKSHAFYSVHEHKKEPDWIANHMPDLLNNCFLLLPSSRRAGMVWWEDYSDQPYYDYPYHMKWGEVGGLGVSASEQDFTTMAKCITDKEGRCSYVCNGTTLHWAIGAAAVLGAKKVYVVGGEAKGGWMKKHGSFYPNIYPLGLELDMGHWRLGTKCLAKVFKPHGIEIVFYYYGKGEVNPETITR